MGLVVSALAAAEIDRPVKVPSLANIPDAQTALVFRALFAELEDISERLDQAVSSGGVIKGHLPEGVSKVTKSGVKVIPSVNEVTAHVGGEDVAAGALATGDDLDDVSDGSTFLKVTGVSGSHQVQATSIATGAVETAKLAADAVDGTKLADNAIANEHLGTGVVGAAEIATNAVTAVKINASSVTATKIGADAVDGTKLADNAVSNEHIGSGAVSNDEIASGADISPSKVLISGSINLDDWRHSADNEKIAGSKLGNLSVDTAQIAANAVETAKINGVAVTSAKLAADSVVAGKIADNAVDSGAIFTLAIQEALIDYNDDDGPASEAEWDAI